MSSVRLVDIKAVDPDEGACHIVCDWNKGGGYATGLQREHVAGLYRSYDVRTHAKLSAALSRCARLAKKMKL
jgi:hypothetical protein